MPISRRRVIAGLGAVSTLALLPRAAFAKYPERPIRLIVPFAAGGNADIVGRIVGDRISNALGQPVVIDNRGGAGGSIGAEAVARSAPDGYTLLVASNGPLTVNPFVQAKLGYDPLKDFAPIALTSYVPHVIILNSKVEAKTIAELIALVEKGPDQHRHQRCRQRHPYDARALQGGFGRKHRSRALPQRRRADAGPDRRQHPGGDDGILHRAAAAQRRPGPHHRDCGGAAARSSRPTSRRSSRAASRISSRKAISGSSRPPARRRRSLPTCRKRSPAGLTSGEAPDKLRDMGSEIATAKQMTPDGFAEFIRTDYENMRQAAKLAGITPQ